jgi:hypothetical protein
LVNMIVKKSKSIYGTIIKCVLHVKFSNKLKYMHASLLDSIEIVSTLVITRDSNLLIFSLSGVLSCNALGTYNVYNNSYQFVK